MTTGPEDDSADAKKRVRSPAYPYVSLPKAIDHARKFWDIEHHHAVRASAAIENLGFAAKSGPGAQTLAALLHFGLLEGSGSKETRTVRLTPLAMRILQSGDPAAIRQAALLPNLYGDLVSKYGADALPSDRTIRDHLLFDRKFNAEVVDGVVRAFRETVSFANLTSSDMMPKADSDGTPSGEKGVESAEEEVTMTATADAPGVKASAPLNAIPHRETAVDLGEVERLRFNLKGGRRVRLMLTGHLPTQEDIDKLIKNLELNKDTFPETVEDES